ncbi:hypothetical protein UCDDA912_g00136 [Diaporthe ampelina]|uniref:Uncharacterized protein n=1 Tax=Diaporthe ampelina TaxID=1214573 RepID=A0A0G2G0G6_9PEZI|nr:hypothetical protein UCDDA912_g00136 [Diaporthe ampelina]
MTAKKTRSTGNPSPCGLSINQLSQVDNQKLAELSNISSAETAGRRWRHVKAKIMAATPSSTPGSPATPATPDDGNPDEGNAAAVAAADPGSPSLLASKKKSAAGGAVGKLAGRKRTMRDTDGAGDSDGGANGESGGAEDCERPKKAAKRVKGKTIVTMNVAQGDADVIESVEV